MIESGLLEALPQLLNHSNQVLRKEAVWILSSIAAGTVSQVQKAIDAGLVQQAFDILNNSESPVPVKKEAFWVLRNICSLPNGTVVQYLLDRGVVEVFHQGMITDNLYIPMCLKGLVELLNSCFKETVIQSIKDYGVIGTIEGIMSSTSSNMTELAGKILSIVNNRE